MGTKKREMTTAEFDAMMHAQLVRLGKAHEFNRREREARIAREANTPAPPAFSGGGGYFDVEPFLVLLLFGALLWGAVALIHFLWRIT